MLLIREEKSILNLKSDGSTRNYYAQRKHYFVLIASDNLHFAHKSVPCQCRIHDDSETMDFIVRFWLTLCMIDVYRDNFRLKYSIV